MGICITACVKLVIATDTPHNAMRSRDTAWTVSTTLQAPTVKAAYLVTMAMPPVGLLQTVSPAPARSIFPATISVPPATWVKKGSCCAISVSLDTQDRDATDVPMDTSASHLCQGVPASPVIAMATWTYPYLAAVIQSLASVCAVDRAMAAPIATVALKGTMETPSRQKAASPVSAIPMALYLRSAIRRLGSASAEKMWLDDSATSACPRCMASPQVECVSRVIVTRLVPSRLTVMRTVSVGVSRASQDPNVTGAHEDTSTSRRVAAHPVSAVMSGITATPAQDSASALRTLSVRDVTAVLPTTGATISPPDARSVAAA